MSQITRAIAAKQKQITQLRSDVAVLQQAASIMGGGADGGVQAGESPATAAAEAASASQPTTSLEQPKKPRAPWSAARRKRMKAYWAKRRRAAKG